MKIFIKNMVCQGTRKFVLMEIKKLGLKLKSFESDEIEFYKDLSPEETSAVLRALSRYGLEVMSQKINPIQEFSIGYFTPEPKIVVKEYACEKSTQEHFQMAEDNV